MNEENPVGEVRAPANSLEVLVLPLAAKCEFVTVRLWLHCLALNAKMIHKKFQHEAGVTNEAVRYDVHTPCSRFADLRFDCGQLWTFSLVLWAPEFSLACVAAELPSSAAIQLRLGIVLHYVLFAETVASNCLQRPVAQTGSTTYLKANKMQ